MGVTDFVKEGNWTKNLFEKGLDHTDWETSVLVHFDNFVKGFAQWSEGQAEVLIMVKRVNITYKALLIILVPSVDFLENIFLDFGRVDITIDRTNNLR